MPLLSTEIAVSVNEGGLPVAIQPERGITMVQDNCAHEAPRERHAHAPTGFRRWSPGLLETDRVAEAFAGLPEGVKAAGQLLSPFKEAAPHLGASPRLVYAVDWLFPFTQPPDWGK